MSYHRVIFKNTIVNAPFNKALWAQWNVGQPNTDHVTMADYNSTGSGVSGATRPSWVTVLSASQAAQYSISSAVGSDYTSWVDMAYFV
jgi:pectinesterase